MFKSNEAMTMELIKLFQSNRDIVLTSKLRRLADDGLTYKDGCVFFRDLEFRRKNYYIENDLTGLEAFVNSINFEDYVRHNHLAIALRFLKNISRMR